LPLIPCSDGAGVVEAVGPGVTRWQIWDRVCGLFAQDWLGGPPTSAKIKTTLGGPLDGTLCTHRVFPESGLIASPDHLTDEEASTLPCAALTAWSSLVTHGNVTAGDTVLLLGTGGVSIFALQLARAMGARVVVTSSSDEKLARARDMGADATVNYKEHPDWHQEVLARVGPVDHVVEVGGAGTFDRSVRSVKVGGTISLIGVLAGPREVNLTRVLMHNIRVQGILVGHAEGFAAMNRALEANDIHPIIDRRFTFDEASDALHHLASGQHFGKVVIRIDGIC
jgi:NADPH:quinone reductase-like Zn-dependent oxidoreductase